MKIVQLIAVSNYIGGDQAHVIELVSGLIARGHHCIVLLGPSDGTFQERLTQLGIEVKVLPSLYKPIHLLRDARAFCELIFVLRRIRPDLIAAHTSKAGFLGRSAGRLLGIPSVFTPHGWSIVDRASGRISRGYRILERIAGRLGSRVIAVSKNEQVIGRANRLAPSENIFVVYNGIADIVEQPRPTGADCPIILMIARFQKQKDQATLLRALARLKDHSWQLQFVGGGPLLQEVRGLAASLGIVDRVAFLGERTDTQTLLANADIFVLSSHWEAFPISTVEAMRAGLPVIVSDVGGASEAVIEGSTGFVVPKMRDDLMAQSLATMLSDAALRERLGRNGRALFLNRFTLDPMIDATLGVYRATCADWKEELVHSSAGICSLTVSNTGTEEGD
ncbi:glycosyltransferase family 4 protein [Edaphobacter paludis]|uniref:Glycosyltransferase family 4 protein n=1 Tax=Edaphobacter paludis TaxID=3035702 RepID=A0AAU7D4E7_9BACT